MELEDFFRIAVPIFGEATAGRAVAYWWCRGAIIRAAIVLEEVRFDLVEPDTPEMEHLVRGAGPDRLLEIYTAYPPSDRKRC